ncbi:MAG: hypothetical protein PHU74_01945 [Candidatus Pacebacteria bacterium]|nr:hypothetical protein [Candidatus Paceibacterota bacterium]
MTKDVSSNTIVKKKDKTSAILLTFFFGFWGWLYTYHVDKTKFWIACILFIVGIITAIVGVGFLLLGGVGIMNLYAFIEACTRDKNFFNNYK